MPIYSAHPADEAKSCKTRGSNLRVHFKNTREAAMAIKGLSLKRAQRFLQDVIKHKDIVPVRRYKDGVGRHPQAAKYGVTQGRWPEKSCRYLLDLLQNAESNAEIKGLDVETLFITHIQVNQAPKMRRRTYRAHGRINPYMACPAHIEMILSQKTEGVRRPAAAAGASARAAPRPNAAAERRLKSGSTVTPT